MSHTVTPFHLPPITPIPNLVLRTYDPSVDTKFGSFPELRDWVALAYPEDADKIAALSFEVLKDMYDDILCFGPGLVKAYTRLSDAKEKVGVEGLRLISTKYEAYHAERHQEIPMKQTPGMGGYTYSFNPEDNLYTGLLRYFGNSYPWLRRQVLGDANPLAGLGSDWPSTFLCDHLLLAEDMLLLSDPLRYADVRRYAEGVVSLVEKAITVVEGEMLHPRP